LLSLIVFACDRFIAFVVVAVRAASSETMSIFVNLTQKPSSVWREVEVNERALLLEGIGFQLWALSLARARCIMPTHCWFLKGSKPIF
jgi:hypothetical protein